MRSDWSAGIARLAAAVGVAALIGLTACAGDSVSVTAVDTASERTPANEGDANLVDAGPRFLEVTDEVGLSFSHSGGDKGDYMMPAIMRGGLAVFDANSDGRLDIYVTNSGPRLDSAGSAESGNRLFVQLESGSFEDGTKASGVGDRGYGMGAVAFDADNDGDEDLYVTNYGDDGFYRNVGDGTFEEATRELGLGDDGWSTSAIACDYDRDGYLDLYVTRYVAFDDRECVDDIGRRDFCGPTEFPGVNDLLYRNVAGERFEDVSVAAGIHRVEDAGLGVVCADLDQDGLLDFYVANDADPNNLWLNRGDGSFVDDAVLLGAATNQHGQSEAGMGVSAGDADGDGDLDLFMTHLIDETNTFYENLGELGFEDTTATVAVGVPSLVYTGFGTAFFDADNDGYLDIAVVNGATKRRPQPVADREGWFWNDYAEPDLLLGNVGEGRFRDWEVMGGDFVERRDVGRALVPADLDGDGDYDLVVANTGGPVRVFRNTLDGLSASGNWLRVVAVDPALRRVAIGATVELTVAGRRLVRPVLPFGGYQSSGPTAAHFGLGKQGAVEELRVSWPDGSVEVFDVDDVNLEIRLERGTGRQP